MQDVKSIQDLLNGSSSTCASATGPGRSRSRKLCGTSGAVGEDDLIRTAVLRNVSRSASIVNGVVADSDRTRSDQDRLTC